MKQSTPISLRKLKSKFTSIEVCFTDKKLEDLRYGNRYTSDFFIVFFIWNSLYNVYIQLQIFKDIHLKRKSKGK